jgi:NitT/TauT family transport system permease protein
VNALVARLTRTTLVIAAGLVGWEAAYVAGLLDPLIFGAPSLVVAAALKDGRAFLGAFQVTSYEMALAVAISWIGGIAIGVALGLGRFSSVLLAPVLSGIIALPLVVLYPAFVAWLGIGTLSKIAYGAAAGFFPIALTTMLGVRSIDQRYLVMARAMGASPWQMVSRVIVRLSLPAIVSGLRIGTSIAIIGVVQSEMLAATDGIGFWISYHRTLFNIGHVYLGIILVLLVAAAANLALSLLEARAGRWRETLVAAT